jgi:hypothetical protein
MSAHRQQVPTFCVMVKPRRALRVFTVRDRARIGVPMSLPCKLKIKRDLVVAALHDLWNDAREAAESLPDATQRAYARALAGMALAALSDLSTEAITVFAEQSDLDDFEE